MSSRALRSNTKNVVNSTRTYSVTTRNSLKVQHPRGRGRPPKLKNRLKAKLRKDIIEDLQKSAEANLIEEINNHSVTEEGNDVQSDKPTAEVAVKRKRGRPRNPTKDTNPEPPVKKKVVIKEEDTIKKADETSNKNATTLDEQPRRKPRMASLNAIAKVNAVLESYRTENKYGKDNVAKVTVDNKSPITDEVSKEKEPVLVTQNDIEQDDVFLKPIPIIIEKADEAIQTERMQATKAVQTERFIYPVDRLNSSLCTCKQKKSISRPRNAINSSIDSKIFDIENSLKNSLQIHIRSNTLSRTKAHTLVMPLVKKHSFPASVNTLNVAGAKITGNISTMLDFCIKRNFAEKSNYPNCNKLLYLNAQKEVRHSMEQKKDPLLSLTGADKKNGLQNIVIPSVDIKSLVTTIKSKHHQKNNKQGIGRKEATNKPKFLLSKSQPKQKICNGWQFSGNSYEETYVCGKETITRKYYQCLTRNNELVQVYDSVVLKSGMGTAEADFVARICSFWEDNIGQFAGEMMMSVQWYYKPQQTISKPGQEIHKGEPMEVFASRHKDDNSVACIVERCYVVTFSQYCRFKAQRQLLLERRQGKLPMVPESSKSRSRLIPNPNFDPSLVFFCRFGYDYRSGKLIKSQY